MGRAQKLFSVHLVLLWCVREQVDIRIAGHRYLYASLVIRAQSMRRHVCRFKTGLSPLDLSFTLTFAYVHDVFYRSQLKIIEHFCIRVRSNTTILTPQIAEVHTCRLQFKMRVLLLPLLQCSYFFFSVGRKTNTFERRK